MANSQNPPVDILNYSEAAASASSDRGSDNRILTKNVLPMLETRLQRFVMAGERQATITERAKSPLVRFSVSELIGFLEDAAVQVASRTDSQYLQSIRTSRSPDANGIWDFGNDLRLLGGTASIDGTTRAQRVSGEHHGDVLARGDAISVDYPVYVYESDLHIYAALFDNPITSEIDTISLPQPTTLSATGTYTPSTDVFTITSGDALDPDLHTLVNAVITDTSGGPAIRGVLTDLTTSSARLEIDDTGFGNTGTITMTWNTPGYSSLNNFLEKSVVALASADMFAALGQVGAVETAIGEFEDEMKQYGLRFFKI